MNYVSFFHLQGCADELFKELEENSVLVAGLVIGIGAVQVRIIALCTIGTFAHIP